MATDYIFKRHELKYMLSRAEYEKLMAEVIRYVKPDKFAHSRIINIYFDTPSKRIIRDSIEKPVYKEKLRLRSYGVSSDNSEVFIELKKKYKSVVYKRRLETTEHEAMDYLMGGMPLHEDSQIAREIDYFMQVYKDLEPSVVLSYERDSYRGIDDPELRITFDYNVLWQNDSFTLKEEPHGNRVIPEYKILMEIKAQDALPLWLTHLLAENEIYRTSFSKYGTAYTQMISEAANCQGYAATVC